VRPGREREALLRIADQLCAELGFPGADKAASRVRSFFAEGTAELMLVNPRPEDESLVAAIRRGLESVAVAVSAGRSKNVLEWKVGAVLDATELVMRGELARGSVEQLPALMPSFVFLVVLSIVGQDEALRLSRRAEELIEGGWTDEL
jgi:hypothetical protein